MSNSSNSLTQETTDGLDAPALAIAGFLAAVGTFVLIVGLQVLYLSFEEARSKAELRQGSAETSASLLAEQRSKLNRYGWLDRSKGVVAIPIDRAIQITAQEHQRGAVISPNGLTASPSATSADSDSASVDGPILRTPAESGKEPGS